MKNKGLIAFLITIVSFLVLLFFTSSLHSYYLNDAIKSANNIASQGIINDKSHNVGDYNLTSTITRREMLKVMMNTSGEITPDKCEGKFYDMYSHDWGCKFAERALNLGFLSLNKYFNPDNNVSKAEALKMIMEARGIKPNINSDWRKGYLSKALELGIIGEFSDFNYSAIRGWIFILVDNVLSINPNNIVDKKIEKEDQIVTNNSIFEIEFDDAMNRDSVETNFRIFPETKTFLSWKSDKKLEIALVDEFDSETEFLVNITDAKNSDLEKIDKAIIKKFKIAGNAKIDFVSPEGEITDLTKNITVRFSRPVVKLTNFDNMTECPIVIEPKLDGKCVWITTSTFQFRPDQGFPVGANYNVTIPSGFKTVAGDKTTAKKSFNIKTPNFKVLNAPNKLTKDDKLNITFNDDISLEDFKKYFVINDFSTNELNINYLKSKDGFETYKNIVSIFPKSGDWGYSNKYSYIINNGLTSIRGNIPLNTINTNLVIGDLLTSYKTFVFNNISLDDYELISNMSFSSNKNVITKKGANILLQFHEEVDLNKTFFSLSGYDYDLNYAKKSEYIDGDNVVKVDKKSIILSVKQNINPSILLKILASKISNNSKDIILSFSTKNDNSIESFKFIDYNKSCLVTKDKINTGGKNLKNFELPEGSRISYVSLVNKYNTYEKDCSYVSGKNTYILNTRISPDKDIELKINKDLIDDINYSLDSDYIFNFHTNKAKNQDKYVSVVDHRDNILVPTDINPLGVAVQTVNLSKISVEVCEGDLDITKVNNISNKVCKEKTIEVKDLGFKTNFSVLNLNDIFEKDFSLGVVSLKVSKLDVDKTENELKSNDYYGYRNDSVNFIRGNTSVVIKSNSVNNLLWLNDFRSGENISNQILKIESYRKKSEYDSNRRFLGYIGTYKSSYEFISKENGLYELDGKLDGMILITLKNGKKVLVENVYDSYNTLAKKIFLTTDKPIYKPGDKVYIKGTVRQESDSGYDISTKKETVYIRNSRYKKVFNESVLVNSNGSFSVEFDLNEDSSLGNYSINVGNDNLHFGVEKYEKPDFKVETKAKKETYYYGEIPKVEVLGEYYIGASLSKGNGTYNLSASDFNFDGGKTKGFLWGENNNYWRFHGPTNSKSSSNIQNNVKFDLDNNGKAILDIDTSNTTNDKIYNISSTITDPNTKKSISSNTSFKLLKSDTFVGMKFDKYYYNFGDNSNITFASVDINGNKKSFKDLNFKIYKIDYSYDENTYKYDKKETLILDKKLKTNQLGLANYNYRFDNTGEYRFEIELDDLLYKTTKSIYVSGSNLVKPVENEHNISILSDKEKYNIGDKAEFVIQSDVVGVKALVTVEKLNKVFYSEVIDINTNSQIFNLDIKKEYLPNFELKVFIVKNVENSRSVIEELKLLRSDMLKLEQDIINSGGDEILPVPYFPICFDIVNKGGFIYPPIYTNGNYDLDLLKQLSEKRAKEQSLMQEIIPNYMLGEIGVEINTASVELNSIVNTDKGEYLPGDNQTITLLISDKNGNPVNGEALISIVDESLLALKNNDINILDFFYSNKSNYIKTFYNMSSLIKRFEFNLEEKKEAEVYLDESESFGMARGGLMTKGLSMNMVESVSMDIAEAPSISDDSYGSSSSNSTKLRTNFKDLAYYNSKVNIVNGVALVDVSKLPDNLTTWVIKGYVITKDTKVGDFENTFKVKKKLNLLPSIPRVFVSEDELEISSLVVNNSSESLDVNAKLSITNAQIIESNSNVVIKANSTGYVSWKVKIDGITNDIDINNFNSNILIFASAGNLVDSLELNRKIFPYATSEYVFTNGSTNDLSYEEKIFLGDDVSKNAGSMDISIGGTILTSLLKDMDKILYNPYDNFYSILGAIKNGAVIKKLYSDAGEIDLYNDIRIKDYNGALKSVDQIINEGILKINDFKQSDGGFAYYINCVPYFNRNTCSNLGLTGDFLQTVKKLEKSGFIIDKTTVNNALEFYKKGLEQKISDYEKYGNSYKNIESFYKILGYDKSFINKYILSNRFSEIKNFSNLDKLKYVLILQNTDFSNRLIKELISDFKNNILIEARGSLLPSGKNGRENVLSTSLALKVLIENSESEKLIIENFARYIVAQKNNNGGFYSTYSTSEVIESINDYILYTNELANMDFEATGYLNNNEIIKSNFNETNKFDMYTKSFDLKDNIKFGSDNFLGFEKVGKGKLYYDVGLRYYLPIDKIEARDEGIVVKRSYYNYDDYKGAYKKECYVPFWLDYNYGGYYRSYAPCTMKKVKQINEVNGGNKGDLLIGEIEIIVPSERNNVIVNNYIPAGSEIVNTNLDTTSEEIKSLSSKSSLSWYSGYDHIENHEEKQVLFASHLSKGTYKYTYVLKLNNKGLYHHRPALAEEIKKPEIFGRTSGKYFEIK